MSAPQVVVPLVQRPSLRPIQMSAPSFYAFALLPRRSRLASRAFRRRRALKLRTNCRALRARGGGDDGGREQVEMIPHQRVLIMAPTKPSKVKQVYSCRPRESSSIAVPARVSEQSFLDISTLSVRTVLWT